jgi:hypothetical protein
LTATTITAAMTSITQYTVVVSSAFGEAPSSGASGTAWATAGSAARTSAASVTASGMRRFGTRAKARGFYS